MQFPSQPKFHPFAMFVKDNAEKTSWLTMWPCDHFRREMSQLKEAQVTCTVPCFHNKRIFRSCKPRFFLFHQTGIYMYIQINCKKKNKKKKTDIPTPTPKGRFTETQSPTHNVGCLLMATLSFSSLLNCTSPCGPSSRRLQFLELGPHGKVQFNKDEKLQDAI